METWTFGGIDITPLRETDASGVTALPTWQREARVITRGLLGPEGRVAVDQIGYGPWQLTMPIAVDDADAAALLALQGQAADLSDGITTWQATGQFVLVQTYGTGYHTGSAVFTRL